MVENKNEGLTITAPIAVWATALTGLVLEVDSEGNLTSESTGKHVVHAARELHCKIKTLLPPHDYQELRGLWDGVYKLVEKHHPGFIHWMDSLRTAAQAHYNGHNKGTEMYKTILELLSYMYPPIVVLEFKN